jgi:phosphocarrier protein HPr
VTAGNAPVVTASIRASRSDDHQACRRMGRLSSTLES